MKPLPDEFFDPFIVGESEIHRGSKPQCDMCGREVDLDREEKGRRLIPMAFFICSKCWEGHSKGEDDDME